MEWYTIICIVLICLLASQIAVRVVSFVLNNIFVVVVFAIEMMIYVLMIVALYRIITTETIEVWDIYQYIGSFVTTKIHKVLSTHFGTSNTTTIIIAASEVVGEYLK
jgi:hypothetical protein